MSENSNQQGFTKDNLFSKLYRTRIKVQKGSVTIVNLSALFSIVSLLCAPWLVVIGAIVALVLGYRFSWEKNASDFGGSFESVVRNAASNVKSAVESFAGETQGEPNPNDGTEDPR